MTLYARSDIDLINVPVESGGCGAPHLREVTHGARAKLFVLNCPGCENFARSNLSDLWSSASRRSPRPTTSSPSVRTTRSAARTTSRR